MGRIICGDNTKVLSGFPDACIDLVVTSPPYDDLRTYGGHSWSFETLAAQLVRVLKPGGVIVWVVADATVDGSETLTSMRQAIHFKDVCGLNVHDTMIYRKLTYLPMTHNRYEQAWEYMFVLSKGKPKCFTPKLTALSSPRKRVIVIRNGDARDKVSRQNSGEFRIVENVFSYKCGGGHTDTDGLAHQHPAPFPEMLAKDTIASWSNPGDVILDPFSGSGTTCKAAKELNRQFIGVEINSDYCKLAEARLSQDVFQLEVCDKPDNAPSCGQLEIESQTL